MVGCFYPLPIFILLIEVSNFNKLGKIRYKGIISKFLILILIYYSQAMFDGIKE
jgi:hypothetical protein